MDAPDSRLQADPRRQEATAVISGFTLSGNASLRTLAEFYGISMPGMEPRATLGEFVTRACDGSPRVGDQAAWERVALVVREIEDNDVRKVCLRIVPLRDRRRPDAGGSARGTVRRAQDRVPGGGMPERTRYPFQPPAAGYRDVTGEAGAED